MAYTRKNGVRRLSPRLQIVPGDAPGTLRPIAGSNPASVTVLSFLAGELRGEPVKASLSDLPKPSMGGNLTHWVRVTGMGDLTSLQEIFTFYGISSLALEDILTPGWRSRVELSGEYLFLVLQTPYSKSAKAQSEHLYLFCKENLVISFEESSTALLDSLWERLRASPALPLAGHSEYYLMYLVLDALVDRFFPYLDQKDEALASLDDALSDNIPENAELQDLHKIKRELLTLRRLAAPYREIVQALRQSPILREAPPMQPFLRDLNDHIVQVEDLLGCYHEIADSLSEICQAALSNRMNDIIKMLTIISTVFMPLSFLAGLYGMNFDVSSPWNMPELRSPYGYPSIVACMLFIVVGMGWFFRKKKWL